MKRLGTSLCVFLFVMMGISIHALAQSTQRAMPTDLRSASVHGPLPETYDLSRLRSPATPEEFLNLLREISENFLLLNPKFHSEENLHRLFGPGKFSTNQRAPDSDWLQMLTLEISQGAAVKNWAGEKIFFTYAKYPDSGKKSASLSIRNLYKSNSIDADLIEAILMPGVQGYDPLRVAGTLEIPENLDAASRRDSPTNHKGYFRYEYLFENVENRSRTYVDLHGNAHVLGLEIDQKEKGNDN